MGTRPVETHGPGDTQSVWDREESSRRRERRDGLVLGDTPRATGLPQ